MNSSVCKYNYLNENINFRLPPVDKLVKIVKMKGKGCMMFKRDLKKAYRQIFVDPGNTCIPLLGFTFEGLYYFDITFSMGATMAAYQWRIQDLPLGGGGRADLRCIHFLAKTYVKTEEMDPVGGVHASSAPPPPDLPMLTAVKGQPMP